MINDSDRMVNAIPLPANVCLTYGNTSLVIDREGTIPIMKVHLETLTLSLEL